MTAQEAIDRTEEYLAANVNEFRKETVLAAYASLANAYALAEKSKTSSAKAPAAAAKK